jgi:hypothetical protein
MDSPTSITDPRGITAPTRAVWRTEQDVVDELRAHAARVDHRDPLFLPFAILASLRLILAGMEIDAIRGRQARLSRTRTISVVVDAQPAASPMGVRH